MKKAILSILPLIFIAACSKDKFNTVPTVQIKSFGPDVVVNKDFFRFRATVTDKEGDIQDSVFFYLKLWNGTNLLEQDTSNFYSLQAFGSPVKDKVELELNFSYGEIRDGYIYQGLVTTDRELSIGVIVKDNAGHKSSYVESKKILLKKF